MRMGFEKKSREGFSLIEVIVAVAILAIVSIPILMYFTNAAIESAHGKRDQAADMAAQSVVEEIDAMEDFTGLMDMQSKLDKLSGGWTAGVSPTPDPAYPAATAPPADQHVLMKSIKIDDNEYKARVTVDYTKTATDPTKNKNLYNNYDNPHIPNMYSPTSVVAEETDQKMSIAYRLYKNRYGKPFSGSPTDPDLVAILNAFQRWIAVDIKEDATDSDYLIVRVNERYTFDSSVYGGTGMIDVTVKSSRVKKGEDGNGLKNIYVIFNPMDATRDHFVFDIAGIDSGKKVDITFVAQKTDTITNLNDYNPTIASVGEYYRAYGNFGSFANGIVATGKDRRIANVKVEILWGTDADDSTDVLATSQTTKTI